MSLFLEEGLGLDKLHSLKAAPSNHYPYSRKLLYAGPECEVMLATWANSLSCAPHDHGISCGWVFYLQGDFEEMTYRWQDGLLKIDAKRLLPVGSHIDISENTIHSCKALSQGLSLHIYFPRIEGMRVHDLRNQQTLLVADDCGAWIPSNKKDVKEIIQWPLLLASS